MRNDEVRIVENRAGDPQPLLHPEGVLLEATVRGSFQMHPLERSLDRIGASGWAARTNIEWARMLVRRSQGGDAGLWAEAFDKFLCSVGTAAS